MKKMTVKIHTWHGIKIDEIIGAKKTRFYVFGKPHSTLALAQKVIAAWEKKQYRKDKVKF